MLYMSEFYIKIFVLNFESFYSVIEFTLIEMYDIVTLTIHQESACVNARFPPGNKYT